MAGEESRALDYRVRFGDQELGKRVVFIFHEDSVYTLTLTSLPTDFRQVTAELEGDPRELAVALTRPPARRRRARPVRLR